MKLKAGNTTEGTWYAPDVGDNRDKPDESRAEVKIAPATQADVDRIRRAAQKRGLSTKSDEELQFEASKVLFLERVTDLRNWFFEDEDGNESPLSTAADLLDVLLKKIPAITGRIIFNEICMAITEGTRLEDGARKNSSSRSGSS